MEDVLHQYALPYDPMRPLICFDERPCFLIDDVCSILPMSPGKAKRCHIVHDVFRNTQAHFADRVMAIACGLHNLRVRGRSAPSG
jgi:hypothetical protein